MKGDEDMVTFTGQCILFTLQFMAATLAFIIIVLWTNTHRNPIEVFFT